MKIGFVLDDTLDTQDGVQQYVINMSQWLRSQGHEVHYLVGETHRTDLPNIHSLSRNIKVAFNGNRMTVPMPVSKKRMRLFLAQQQFDILHIQMPYSPFMAGVLLAVAPQKTAVVGTFHILAHSWPAAVGNRVLAFLNRSTRLRFDRVWAVSKPTATWARNVYGYDCGVVANPIRLTQFAGAHSTSKDVSVVFMGRLVPRKGPLLLLEALKYILDYKMTNQEFKLLIGGRGPLLEDMERYVDNHGLRNYVVFSGQITEDIKRDFLAQADIAVFPSVAGETFGIVLPEAMAASRGVVLAGNNPGYRSVMEPLNPGQLFNPYNKKEFATILCKYLESPALRSAATKAQRMHVKRYDVNVIGPQVMSEYKKALRLRRG